MKEYRSIVHLQIPSLTLQIENMKPQMHEKVSDIKNPNKKKKRPWESFDIFSKEYRTEILENSNKLENEESRTINIHQDRSLVERYMFSRKPKKMKGILSLIKVLFFS